ncbi:MAG TPA: HAMP domain-containing sensor histidine kinase [Thermoanaerobaculia bacterium]|jgi:signal transduction histidine kinase
MATQPTPTSASPSSPGSEGLAFVLDVEGRVRREVVTMLPGATLDGTLCGCVADATRDACSIFLRAIASRGFARSMPLRAGSRDVHGFGSCEDDLLYVVLVVDPSTAASFAEQAGFTKLAEEVRRTHSTYELYDELARTNNDLVTAQRELARTVAELTRLNAYKDELLGMAAHDLRNPLSANLAFVTFLLQDSAGFSADNLHLLHRLRTNNAFMLRLVEDVLDFSAVQSGKVQLRPEESDVVEVVRSVVETMRIVAERKSVSIHLDAEEDFPRMSVDRIKITQAVQNLVSNAVSYSPGGAAVHVHVTRDEGHVSIAVQDRGPGIPADEVPNLFQPFVKLSTSEFTTDRSTGLGLAITRRLVEAHGGTIGVETEVGSGSTFVIRL